jgi:hypothetical protein
MDDWAKKKLAELHARAPVKRKKIKAFAMVELDAAAKALTAVNCQKAMVYLWLVHQTRKTGKTTVAMPNGALAKYGLERRQKYRALRQFEMAGVAAVEWRPRKTPLVTLLRRHRLAGKSVS